MRNVLESRDNCNTMKNAGELCEIKTGQLYLVHRIQGSRMIRTPVKVTVHRSSFEHYAVIYKDQICPGSACVFLNLKSCRLLDSDNPTTQIFLVPDTMEGTVITLDTAGTSSSRQEWLSALTYVPSSPLGSCRSAVTSGLPPLQELEEE